MLINVKCKKYENLYTIHDTIGYIYGHPKADE